MTNFIFKKIGTIKSCFKQKFAIPRQPGIVKSATATIILEDEFSSKEVVRGLDNYSHIWVIFVFHTSKISKNKNTVRPPRLGGDKRMGIFATRSNYRPNPIGQSVVKLDGVEFIDKQVLIHLSGVDFLDGTPVLDIKPYIPYVDSVSDARARFATHAPEKEFLVVIEQAALDQVERATIASGQNIKYLIEELLSYDPRPRHTQPGQIFATRLFNYDLKWKIENNVATVVSLETLS